MMRLLTIFPTQCRGGNEEYALTIAGAALEGGWQSEMAFPQTPGMTSLIQDCAERHIPYHPVAIAERSNRRLETNVRDLARLMRTVLLLHTVKPDVVHLCLPWPDLCFGSIMACAVAHVPAIVVFQLVPHAFTFRPKKVELYAWARKRRQTWVAVSDNNRDLLCESFQAATDEIARIYNGAAVSAVSQDSAQNPKAIRSRIRQEFGFPQTSRILLTVARLHPQKGHKDLIPALPYLTQEYPDLQCVWVGDGDQKAVLQKTLQEYGVEDRVFFLGYCRNVPELLQAADLFVFPTHYEGLPFSLVEAMACGIPIVSSDASSIPELIDDHVSGLLFRTGDSCAVLETLRWALLHPEQMREMAENARLRADTFSERRMIEDTLDLFRQAASSGSHQL